MIQAGFPIPYVNAKSYHEQANEVSTPVSDEKKPDSTFEAVGLPMKQK